MKKLILIITLTAAMAVSAGDDEIRGQAKEIGLIEMLAYIENLGNYILNPNKSIEYMSHVSAYNQFI